MEARIEALEAWSKQAETRMDAHDAAIQNLGGVQTEIRESVTEMRGQIGKVLAEWATLHSTINVLIEVSRRREDQYNRVEDKMLLIDKDLKEGQAQDRKHLDDLSEKQALNDARIHDAEQRYIESFTPIRNAIIGSDTQRGLLSKVAGIQEELTTTQKAITPLADFVAEQKKRREDTIAFLKSRPGAIMVGVIVAGIARLVSLDANNLIQAALAFLGG